MGMVVWLGGRHASLVLVLWPAVLLGWRALRSPRASIAAALAVAALSLAYLGTTATLPPENATITSDEYRFWTTLGRVVPKDALVFTSFTGETVTQATGWNYYPAVARRQLYLAGWADSPLQGDEAGLQRRLAVNREVLAGARDPSLADTARRFRGYYAVVGASSTVPSSFVRVKAVGPYALYRIRGT
jgi:hypothetical protein